jgi:GT2 family glycosyltransferase
VRIAAIVLSWNRRRDTLRCLRSLERARTSHDAVICVDNGSSDGTVDAVRADHPGVELVALGRNTGYAHGNNVGIERALAAGADWVLVVNNDVTVRADVFAAIRATAARWPAAGVIAGKLFLADRPDRLEFAGARVRLVLGYSGAPFGHSQPDGPEHARERTVDRASGALMAISREAITRVGGFDGQLFAYVEEVDLCLKARAAGLPTVFAPGVVGWHAVSASSGGELRSTHTVYYGTRNTIVVAERHRPLPAPARGLRRMCVAGSMAVYVLRRGHRRAGLAAVWQGYRDGRLGRLGERR